MELKDNQKSAAYDVVKYTGDNKPKEGHRLSIITFKTPQKEKGNAAYKKPDNLCVSIPQLQVKSVPDSLSSAWQACFEDLQDACIRSLLVNEDGEVIPSKKFILDAEIDFAACAAYAATSAVSGKLTKEVIGKWFDANLEEKLTVALANAMHMPDTPSAEETQKLDAILRQHRDALSACAATIPNLPPKTAKSLAAAVALAEDDRIKQSLAAKLHKLANPKSVEFFGL